MANVFNPAGKPLFSESSSMLAFITLVSSHLLFELHANVSKLWLFRCEHEISFCVCLTVTLLLIDY